MTDTLRQILSDLGGLLAGVLLVLSGGAVRYGLDRLRERQQWRDIWGAAEILLAGRGLRLSGRPGRDWHLVDMENALHRSYADELAEARAATTNNELDTL